jgi:metal-responsive CopG/Arc/MetJ family transcriptional regulator
MVRTTLSIVRHCANRWDKEWQRIAIMLGDDLTDELDRMIVGHGYRNRSEAIRDFIRAGIQQPHSAARI